jgi:hypothetical protein
MNLNELHVAVRAALSKAPDGALLLSLAVEAERMADMTGWAIGPIDPQGQVAAAFSALKQQARLRYEETQSPDVAQLHDALAVLINAIASHDDDLSPDGIGASEDD